jgi:hypothetical protein
VSCRFAFHHFESPVCRYGARVPSAWAHCAVRCHCVGRYAQRRPRSIAWNGTAITLWWNLARSAFYQACLLSPGCRLHAHASIRCRCPDRISFPAADDRTLLKTMIDQSWSAIRWLSTPGARGPREVCVSVRDPGGTKRGRQRGIDDRPRLANAYLPCGASAGFVFALGPPTTDHWTYLLGALTRVDRIAK